MLSKIRAAGVIAALTVSGFGMTGVGAAMAADSAPAVQSTSRGPYVTWNDCNDAGTAGEEDGSWPEDWWHCDGENGNWWILDGPDPDDN